MIRISFPTTWHYQNSCNLSQTMSNSVIWQCVGNYLPKIQASIHNCEFENLIVTKIYSVIMKKKCALKKSYISLKKFWTCLPNPKSVPPPLYISVTFGDLTFECLGNLFRENNLYFHQLLTYIRYLFKVFVVYN